MERSPTKRRWERGWNDLVRLGLLMRRMALDWTLSRRQRVDFGAPPQTWEQCSKEGRIWDLYIDRRWEDEKNPRALARKPSFWDACIAYVREAIAGKKWGTILAANEGLEKCRELNFENSKTLVTGSVLFHCAVAVVSSYQAEIKTIANGCDLQKQNDVTRCCTNSRLNHLNLPSKISIRDFWGLGLIDS